ncbi:MAG: hypothetical protein ABEJ99_00485 [Candidatus Nanohaloarchaea archaeon]
MQRIPDKNCVFTVYSGDLHDLAENVREYCSSRYGDRCEFKSVSIERVHPDGHSWKVHDLPGFDDRTINAIENHLKARRDVVHVSFGGEDEQMSLVVTPARNTSQLARYLRSEDMEGLDEEDLVLLAIEREEEALDLAEEMIDSLEK